MGIQQGTMGKVSSPMRRLFGNVPLNGRPTRAVVLVLALDILVGGLFVFWVAGASSYGDTRG